MNEESEKSYSIPLKFSNIPGSVVLDENVQDDIKVRIKDKGLILLSYSRNKKFSPIEVDVSFLNNQNGKYVVNEALLLSSLKKQLKLSSSILSFSPQQMNMSYTTRVNKKVPVRIKGEIRPRVQSRIADGKISISPDSVEVYASQAVIDDIDYVYTDSLHITDIADDLTKTVGVQKIKGTTIIPSNVSLYVPIEEYTEKRVSLPIEVINLPDTLNLRTFPSNIQVSFFVGLSDFKFAVADSFKVVVDYQEIKNAGGQRVPLSLSSHPKHINNVRLTPDSIEYIIEIK